MPYALASGLGGAVIAEPVLHALDGHLWSIAGIGLTVVIFVILGNPSAGGAYQPGLLPPLWRAISGALPNGAGTDAVRRIVYFDGHGIGSPILVLITWVAAGVLATLIASAVRHRVERVSA